MGAIKIDDNTLERLGSYFVHFNIHERDGITFETFIRRWQGGAYNGQA